MAEPLYIAYSYHDGDILLYRITEYTEEQKKQLKDALDFRGCVSEDKFWFIFGNSPDDIGEHISLAAKIPMD